VSIIVHRCPTCRKPDYWAGSGTAAGRTVNGEQPGRGESRTCHGSTWDDPELAPTFDYEGNREPEVIPPGGAFGAGSRTCDCDDCQAFYAQVAA
jgi:hypothetical protein